MNFKDSLRWHCLAGALALLGLEHCSRPALLLGSPPSLTARIPSTPAVPEPTAQETSASTSNSGHRVTSTHALANAREQTVLLLLSGEDRLRATLAEVLPATLVSARFTRVLLPPSLEGVTGSVERGATGERTTLTGPAERLLPMRANTPIDGVLRVEVRRALDVVEGTTRYEVSAEALQRYAAELERYNTALQLAQQQLRSSVSYASEAQSAIQTYRAQGGRFDDDESRQRMEEVSGFNARYAELDSRLRAALSTPLPQPDAVQRMAAQRMSVRRGATPGVWLRAIYTDLRAGETFWIDEVQVSESDDGAALRQAFSTLMQDLGGT